MKKALLIPGILLISGLFTLIYHYLKIDTLSLEHYKKGEEYIESLHQHNIATTKEIVAAKAGLTKHYDNIVKHQSKAESIANNIKLLLQSQHLDNANLIQKIDKYITAIQQRAVPIEDFKSDNAILQNSLHYYPHAVHQLQSPLQKHDIQLVTTVRQQAMDVLTFYTTNNSQLLKTINKRRSKLQAIFSQLPSSLKIKAAGMLQHEQAILQYSQRVNDAVKTLTNNDQSHLITEFEKHYTQQLQQAQQQVSRDRLLTYMVLGGLMVCAAFLLFRLLQTMVALQDSNTQLEHKVALRTQVLSKRNEELNILDGITQAVNGEDQLSDIITTLLSRTSRLLGNVCRCSYVKSELDDTKVELVAHHMKDEDIQITDKTLLKKAFEKFYLSDLKSIVKGIHLKYFPDNIPSLPHLEGLRAPKVILIVEVAIKQAVGYLLFVNTEHQHAFDKIDHHMIARLREHAITAIDKALLLDALRRQSTTDALTGLNNRHFIDEHIGHDISSVNRLYQAFQPSPDQPRPAKSSLLFFMIDIDHFKQINDQYGHNAGDSVLKQSSELLKSVCRNSSFLVRWGGEEFLVVERFADIEQAQTQAERLVTAFNQYEFILNDNKRLTLSCSIGFSSYPLFPQQVTQLSWEQTLDLADKSLYAAKINARDAWVGIVGANKNLCADELLADPIAAIQSGKVNIISSLKNPNTLKWSQHTLKPFDSLPPVSSPSYSHNM